MSAHADDGFRLAVENKYLTAQIQRERGRLSVLHHQLATIGKASVRDEANRRWIIHDDVAAFFTQWTIP